MENKKNFNIYSNLMLKLITEKLEPYKEELKQNPELRIEQNTYEFFLFDGFNEIINVINTLELIEKFIDTEPPKIDGINYSNYLNYHIHNYFQEMYILKERLKTYATKINRRYKKITDKKLFDSIEEMIIETVDSLSNITGDKGVRNLHVHNKKFIDQELNILGSASFLVDTNNAEFNKLLDSAYIHNKNKWKETISKNNETTKTLIDLYFEDLIKVITKDNIAVINPN